MSAEFDKVKMRLGYNHFYVNIEDAVKILRVFNEVTLLKLETNYSTKPPVEVAIPIEAGFVHIETADPGEAFARIMAGEAIRSKE